MTAASTIDLHAHSTASDGVLSPAALLARACANGVRVLALTDHDTIAGLDEAHDAARGAGMQLVAGVEISTLWERREIHVVGLGVDPGHGPFIEALSGNQRSRWERIRAMAERLETRARVAGVVEAMAAVDTGQPGRLHLARYLVQHGHARTIQQAFDRFLSPGRPGYRTPGWMSLAGAVAAIRQAGGIPVLAHPLAYKMTGAWLRRLIEAFREADGEAIEVVIGTSDRQRVMQVFDHARRYGLKASIGSDFHGPNPAGIEPGRLLPLPKEAVPVWAALRDMDGVAVSA